jgi:predicted acylesterase/phospholipase RssA
MTERTALVLGGGGSLGAVEAGFIRRTMELGIGFDLMVGTSVGAINAAHVAFHAADGHDWNASGSGSLAAACFRGTPSPSRRECSVRG